MSSSAEIKRGVDFVLVNVPTFDAASGHTPVPALDLRLAELTALFTTQTFGLALSEIVVADNHDAALRQGQKDFCLIQKAGHLFHGPREAVAQALAEALDACAFLTGHIMERGGYYYLHDQCVLVNRRAWEKLGRPPFGTPAAGPQHAAVPRRSPENVHDDYTPLFLDPTGEERDWDGAFGYGWQAISTSLRYGLRVSNWGAPARAFKRNCYAYYGRPAEWQRALADVAAAPATDDDGLRGILDFLAAAAAQAADMRDDAAAVDVPRFHVRAGVDHLVMPAGSLSLSRILAQTGFHDRTLITIYAPDADALEAHRRTADRTNLSHRFVIADPVAQPEAFCAACAVADATVVVSVGTLFNNFAAIARFDGARRRMAYDKIAAIFRGQARRFLLIGQPPYVRIRGI